MSCAVRNSETSSDSKFHAAVFPLWSINTLLPPSGAEHKWQSRRYSAVHNPTSNISCVTAMGAIEWAVKRRFRWGDVIGDFKLGGSCCQHIQAAVRGCWQHDFIRSWKRWSDVELSTAWLENLFTEQSFWKELSDRARMVSPDLAVAKPSSLPTTSDRLLT